MVSLPGNIDPAPVVNNVLGLFEGAIGKISGKAIGVMSVVAQLDPIYQFVIFGIFLYVFFKIAQIFMRAVYVALVSAAFPLFLKYVVGMNIALSLQTMLYFMLLGVGVYLIYEKISLIIRFGRLILRAGKVLLWPAMALARLIGGGAKSKQHKAQKKYIELSMKEHQREHQRQREGVGHKHKRKHGKMVVVDERKEKRQRKRRARKMKKEEKEGKEREESEGQEEFKETQQGVDSKAEDQEAEEIWKELEEDEEK